MIERTLAVMSERFQCHISGNRLNCTEFNDLVVFVNSVPQCKLDGHWLRHFRINQSVIALHSRLALRNIVWGKYSVGLAHECYFNMALFVIW
jgi:hypothetical protein